MFKRRNKKKRERGFMMKKGKLIKIGNIQFTVNVNLKCDLT